MIINISEKNKSFFWCPPKTASNLAAMVFDNYDFFAYDSSKKLKLSDSVKHTHSNGFFDNHENYDFILTARNPYNQFISKLAYDTNTIDEIINHLEIYFLGTSHHSIMMKNLSIRKPNYVVKVEEIESDYLKIPFINNSEFHLSGGLKKLINSKPNQYNGKKDFKIPNQDIADLIYYNNLPIFEICGYEKDSWKS